MYAVFQRNKPHANVGTVGHVDWGKIALLSAIEPTIEETKRKGLHGRGKGDRIRRRQQLNHWRK